MTQPATNLLDAKADPDPRGRALSLVFGAQQGLYAARRLADASIDDEENREDIAHEILWICDRAAEALTVVQDLIGDQWARTQNDEVQP